MINEGTRLRSLRDAATQHYRRGEFAAAERLIGEALAIDPQSAELWNNRGTAQAASGRSEAALVSFDRALELRPDFLAAIGNRAHILFALQRFAEAIPDYEKLLAANRDHPYASGDLMFCRLQGCDWRNFAADTAQLRRQLAEGKRALPPVLSLSLFDSAEEQLRAARILAHDRCPPRPPLWRGERYSHARIRIAYVSADFHAHATAVLIAGLIEAHDRARFETTAVSFGIDDGSPMRARLAQAFDRFVDVREANDAAIAALLRQWEIDIAIDLKGYTADARPAVFSRRPAPAQVNFLGYPGSMGAAFMDYIVADSVIVPESHDGWYSEKVVRLPDSYQPNDRRRSTEGNASTRVREGLPESGFVFCCFNNTFKILPHIFDIWMRLLHATEGSVLWLLGDNPAAMLNLRHEAESRGIGGERLVFAPRASQEDHLARHRHADLFLDTLPYNAHTTASDALWCGLPLVTCTGTTFAGRVASSLLQAAGLPELVTQTLDDYESLARSLAHDPARLDAIRTKLASNRDNCALFDAARFTRHLEKAYTTIWERSERGLPPIGFAVTPQ